MHMYIYLSIGAFGSSRTRRILFMYYPCRSVITRKVIFDFQLATIEYIWSEQRPGFIVYPSISRKAMYFLIFFVRISLFLFIFQTAVRIIAASRTDNRGMILKFYFSCDHTVPSVYTSWYCFNWVEYWTHVGTWYLDLPYVCSPPMYPGMPHFHLLVVMPSCKIIFLVLQKWSVLFLWYIFLEMGYTGSTIFL